MTDYKKFEDYEWSEKDLDKVLNFLRIFDPENATQENAIDFLIFYGTAIHEIGHTATDEELEQLYKKFATSKK